RLGGEVVDAVQARQEPVLLARRVPQPAQDVEDPLGVRDQAGLAALVVGAQHRSLRGVVQLLGDQLETRSVRHQWRSPPEALARAESWVIDTSRAAVYASSSSSDAVPVASRAHSS